MLSFQSHLRTLVKVPNRTVRVVEDIGRVIAIEDIIEIVKVGKIGKKTITIGKLLVVSQTLFLS